MAGYADSNIGRRQHHAPARAPRARRSPASHAAWSVFSTRYSDCRYVIGLNVKSPT